MCTAVLNTTPSIYIYVVTWGVFLCGSGAATTDIWIGVSKVLSGFLINLWYKTKIYKFNTCLFPGMWMVGVCVHILEYNFKQVCEQLWAKKNILLE